MASYCPNKGRRGTDGSQSLPNRTSPLLAVFTAHGAVFCGVGESRAFSSPAIYNLACSFDQYARKTRKSRRLFPVGPVTTVSPKIAKNE